MTEGHLPYALRRPGADATRYRKQVLARSLRRGVILVGAVSLLAGPAAHTVMAWTSSVCGQALPVGSATKEPTEPEVSRAYDLHFSMVRDGVTFFQTQPATVVTSIDDRVGSQALVGVTPFGIGVATMRATALGIRLDCVGIATSVEGHIVELRSAGAPLPDLLQLSKGHAFRWVGRSDDGDSTLRVDVEVTGSRLDSVDLHMAIVGGGPGWSVDIDSTSSNVRTSWLPVRLSASGTVVDSGTSSHVSLALEPTR